MFLVKVIEVLLVGLVFGVNIGIVGKVVYVNLE